MMPPKHQLSLAGIPAPEPHGNRGRDFERMLEAVHDYYVRREIGHVEKIANKWEFCTEGEYQRLPKPLKARTGNGRPICRAQTMCDYIGHAGGRGIAFDAKEFKEASISLEMFKVHQVQGLYTFARAGGMAGFMIWSRRLDKVYWVGARQMRDVRTDPNFKAKSLNLKWFEDNAILIVERASHSLIDWAKVLLPALAA